MVENPANAMSSELVSAQAIDAELRTRALELARKGRDDPGALTAAGRDAALRGDAGLPR